MQSKDNPVAAALWGTLASPNVSDSNLEPANVVDVLSRGASEIGRVANAIRLRGYGLKCREIEPTKNEKD